MKFATSIAQHAAFDKGARNFQKKLEKALFSGTVYSKLSWNAMKKGRCKDEKQGKDPSGRF
ncbi:hypothetical protein [Anaeromassilibacillus senegalensis]|uniref:Uncharacterized protein n=1 Tax=Anaeromassilibacillus senegalensis TaxID=1673717 RepID=A0ABS9CN89_9FIRM|nr:hypothetical protein [Anaeromassilibacillus senegalensis]MCF2652255.1 hypothetical protein [Anaeromassilibacillus senegalensis]